MISLSENFMGSMTQFGIDTGRGRNIAPGAGQDAGEYSWQPQAPDIDHQGFLYKHCKSLRADQRQIVEALRRGRDLYISMGAGGGKTMPIFCYWLNDLMGLNVIMDQLHPDPNANQDSMNIVLNILLGNLSGMPKLLFLIPTRALGQQTFEDFQDALKQLMIQYIVKISNNFYHGNTRRESNKYSIDYNNINERNLLRNFLNQVSLFNNPIKILCDNFKNAIRAFLGRFHEEQFTNLIVPRFFDELKLMLIDFVDRTAHKLVTKRDGDGTEGGKPENSLVTIAIYQSAPGVINKLINNNLRAVICDEAHMNQNPTQAGLSSINDKQANGIATGLYKTLNKLKGKRVQLILLSGTIHPNAVNNFTNYLERCYKRKFNKLSPLDSKNETPIKIIKDQQLSNPNNWFSILRNHIAKKDYGVGLIIFSKKQINNLCEKLLQSTGAYNKPGQTQRHKFDRTQIIHKHDLNNNDKIKGIAGRIEDKLLRACAVNGFAFHHSGVNGNDRQIVETLFKDRQISIIIATDSIGVGMNMPMQHLYIPDARKFNGTTKNVEDVPHRELVQLINRVGRGKFAVGYVYTTEKDISLVTQAVFADPNSYPDVDAIKHFKCGSIFGAKYFNSLFFNIVDWYDAYEDLRKRLEK